MQRIKASNNAVLDGNGHYTFTTSNPPFPNTTISAAWLNSMQEEVASVIESAGITLDDTKQDQLLTALGKLNAILTNTTITVTGSAPYAKLSDALEYARTRYIAPGVTLTIQMQTGMVHTISSEIVFRSAKQGSIQIIGNTTTPVVLKVVPAAFLKDQAALTIKDGGRISLITGVQFSYDTTAPTTVPMFAVKATGGGSVTLGTAVDVINFRGCGVVAEEGGVINCSNMQSRNALTTGFSANNIAIYGHAFWARNGGRINLDLCQSSGNSASCAQAENQSVINMTNCFNFMGRTTATTRSLITATGGVYPGEAGKIVFEAKESSTMRLSTVQAGQSGISTSINIRAITNSDMFLDQVTSTFSGVHGVEASFGSRIFIQSCTSSNNVQNGFSVGFGGSISATGTNVASSNGSYGYNAFPYSFIVGTGLTGSSNGLALKSTADAATYSGVQ